MTVFPAAIPAAGSRWADGPPPVLLSVILSGYADKRMLIRTHHEGRFFLRAFGLPASPQGKEGPSTLNVGSRISERGYLP